MYGDRRPLLGTGGRPLSSLDNRGFHGWRVVGSLSLSAWLWVDNRRNIRRLNSLRVRRLWANDGNQNENRDAIVEKAMAHLGYFGVSRVCLVCVVIRRGVNQSIVRRWLTISPYT